ncbi:uncharacterized protein [Tenebrio molitor]|jgi:hypothetical protein|uniref:uncharacterized protein n=1 Tax=Tenebrio molitor TaxID=7067 RepID=UPI001C397C57|nr:unnamed protein product [Tenebrio molitor]
MATEIDDGDLIRCIRQFPSIYDKNHGEYRNKQSKINAWTNIGRMMGVSEDLCEQRWVVLRNRFATELRNRKKNPNAGNSWRFSEAMAFLEEYISPRRTRSSLVADKRTFTQEIKSETKVPQNITSTINGLPPEALVTVELRSTSPNNTTTRLRPIAPRPAMSTVARLVSIPNANDSSVTSAIQNCPNRHSECKEKHEPEDEDILFGKSIGHSLKNIKNKKLKLQIKSEILSILAQHAE